MAGVLKKEGDFLLAGLKVQEEEMLGLVRMVEERQREAKQDIEGLLAKRSDLLEGVGGHDLVSGQLKGHWYLQRAHTYPSVAKQCPEAFTEQKSLDSLTPRCLLLCKYSIILR